MDTTLTIDIVVLALFTTVLTIVILAAAWGLGFLAGRKNQKELMDTAFRESKKDASEENYEPARIRGRAITRSKFAGEPKEIIKAERRKIEERIMGK